MMCSCPGYQISHCESVRGGGVGRGGGVLWYLTGVELNALSSIKSKYKLSILNDSQAFVYPCLVRPLSGIVAVKRQTNDLK